MAKIKTADDLEREANDIIKKAKKEQQLLLQKAKKLREEKYTEIGKKCVEYFKGSFSKEQLETFIINSGFLERKENSTSREGEE